MAAAVTSLFGKPRSAGDNLLFLRLRWMLCLWIAASVAVHWGRGEADWAGAGLVAAFLLTQLALWRLSPRFMAGMQFYTIVFMLDLAFIVLAVLLTDQVSPGLLSALFLSIFITALVRRMSLALLVSGVAMLVYLAFKVQGPDGFAFPDLRQLLDLPVIMLASLHASIVLGESVFHEDISEALDADNQTLSRKLSSAATELKARVRFINSAFDAVPVPALVVDGDGLLRGFNTRAEELFGTRRTALLDRTLKDLRLLEPLRQALRELNGEGVTAAWLSTSRGGHFYASLRCGMARDTDGRLANMAIFVQPAEPPAETPTWEAWVEARRASQPASAGDAGQPPAGEAAGEAPANAAPAAPRAASETALAPAAPAGPHDAAPAPAPASAPAPERSTLQRSLASTVEHDHPDQREKH